MMEKKRGQQENLQMNRNEKVSKTLWHVYLLFLVLSIVIFFQVFNIKLFWQPGDRVLHDPLFTLQTSKKPLKSERGDILDCHGKLLATSTPKYDIHMDCTVMKNDFSKEKQINPKTGVKVGVEKERKWRADAVELSKGLAKILDDGKSAAYYKNIILSGRESGKRYLPITKDIDHNILIKLKELPLFCKNPNYGGMIVSTRDTRQYPYGKLARRVIGYVKNNDDGSSNSIGIEGSFDWALHGTAGVEIMKRSEDQKGGYAQIVDPDSKSTPAINGSNVGLTIDIDIQDIADRALRRQVENDEKIADACMIVMEVKTGAIRAMVNLHRGRDGKMDETDNLAVFRVSEPGSVFKTVGLMTLLEDKKVRLNTRVPTNNGVFEDYPIDQHLKDFEREKHRNWISVKEGLEISSNNVFARLATEHYGKKPSEFIDKIYEYRLGEAYDFDLKGMGRPMVLDPRKAGWSGTSLGTVAYGYGVGVTPLHTITFYNAIANGGKMMKPYLVEYIESESGIVSKKGPSILNGAICSGRTADSLKTALRSVVLHGTARKLKAAKCEVAGKTGTARITLSQAERGTSKSGYLNQNGEFRNQGSFVGFFPLEDPKYTAIVVVYSTLSRTSYYGAQRPAEAFMEVVSGLYGLDHNWSEHIDIETSLPQIKEHNIAIPDKSNEIVPDIIGLGLSDAIYTIENYGYNAEFSGCGKVVSQSPKAGSKHSRGGTVSIRLN